jgi:molecular chaperone GrpE (heat shock protein)
MTEDHILELSLLENGLDFIIRGIDELYELYDDIEYQQYIYPISQPQKDYKYGVLHLFSGFLLLLKERLSHHMPELIFEGRMEDVRRKLDKGKELNTVNLDEALERLEIGPKVIFSESDAKVIRKMQKYRNRFEHYKFSANKFEINKAIIEFIDVIDRFLINELKIDLASDPLNANPQIKAKVLSIESVYRRMTDKRESDLRKLGEEKLKIFQNNRKSILKNLDREAYIAYKEEGGIEITMTCPLCCEDTLIIYGEFAGVCSNEECNSYSLLKSCDRCGQITTGYEWEEKWCDDCHNEIQRMVDRDD